MNLILILLFTIVLSGDIIKGKITDSDGWGIRDVYIESLDNEIISSSDINGFFLIDNSSNSFNSVLFSHIGYKQKQISLADLKNNSNVILEIDIIKSNQIVVTGLRDESYIKNTPVLTHVINSKDIKNSSYSSVKEALEMILPNVQNVVSNHAGISNDRVKIQGIDNKYTLFLIDGERFSSEYAGNIDFNMLDLTNVARIEVVEGGMSSLYGSGAIGGVINIISKQNKKPIWANISYLNESPMVLSKSFNFGFNYNNIFYGLNYVNRKTNGYDLTKEIISSGRITKTLEENASESITHKIKYNISSSSFFQFSHQNYKNDIFLYNNRINFNANTTPDSYYLTFDDSMPTFEDYRSGIKFSSNFNNSKIQIAYNTQERTKNSYFFNYEALECEFNDCNDADTVQSASFINAISENKNLLLKYDLYKKDILTFGFEINDSKYSSFNIYNNNGDLWPIYGESIFNGIDSSRTYFKKEFFIGKQWLLNNTNQFYLSSRYVDSKNYGDNLVYSLAYMIKEFKPYNIRLNYSKGFRTPSIKELFYNFQNHNPPIIGDPELKATTNNYYSFSVDRREIMNSNIALELFYNKIDNMIGIDYGEVYQYRNFEKVSFYGFNCHYERNISNKQNIKFVYNNTQSKSNNIEALELISENSFRLGYLATIYEKKLKLSFNLKYAGEKFFIVKTSNEKISLDDYFISDLLLISNLSKNIEIKMGCKNLFNYIDKRFEFSEILTTSDPGRRYIFELKVNIK